MTTSSEKIHTAGDVKVEDVTIITTRGHAQTITPQVAGIEIYEDIFSTFITGKVYVRDSQDLQNLLPLVGEEVVRIDLKTPKIEDKHAYKGEYYIYKMDDRTKIKDHEAVFVLHFISKEAITDLNRKISRAYSGKVSEIVKEICTKPGGLETNKKLNIEDTSNETKFVSNFWSPSKNLEWCCESAVNANESPSYIFFENKHGLNFLSLESMYVGSPIYQRFIWDNYAAEIGTTGGSGRDLNKDYQRVLDFQMSDAYNYMDRLQSGMYGSEIITYDLLTKQYVHTGYKPDFEKDGGHLNEYPLWTSKAPASQKSVLIYEHNYYNNFEKFGDVTNNKTIQKRMSLMAQAEGYKVTITVHGRTDYTAGMRVYLDVPRIRQVTEKSDDVDQILSGTYLIAAICHKITRSTHECIIELTKDSFMVDINKMTEDAK
jgi:hypothetical protein